MDTAAANRSEQLAILRARMAELREEHRLIRYEYESGHLSLDDEIARLAAINREVSWIVRKVRVLSYPRALS